MSDWILIACLVKLRAEFDAMAPGRDHASDGSIGDAAHQQEVSDHNPDETGSVPIHDADHVNEVHAIDVSVNLRLAGLSMETVVQFLLARCRSGAEERLRYIIFNRRIWQAKNGWRQEAYSGPSAHTEHAHFSASYESALEASTAPWHLEDINMPTAAEIAKAVWEYTVDVDVTPKGVNMQKTGGVLAYTSSEHRAILTQAQAAVSALAALAASEAKDDATKAASLKALQDTVAALGPAVTAGVVAALPAGVTLTQEQLNEAFAAALRTVFTA